MNTKCKSSNHRNLQRERESVNLIVVDGLKSLDSNSVDVDPFAVNGDRECFENRIGLQVHFRIHWNQKGHNQVVETLGIDLNSDLDHWCFAKRAHCDLNCYFLELIL